MASTDSSPRRHGDETSARILTNGDKVDSAREVLQLTDHVRKEAHRTLFEHYQSQVPQAGFKNEQGIHETQTEAGKAMAEIWGTLCPDCGPLDYEGIVKEVRRLRQAGKEKAHG